VDSIDKEELAKLLSLKPDPEDEESQVYRKLLSLLPSQVYQLLLEVLFLKYLMPNRKLRKRWKKRETS
jgi:hypothetical protein